MPPKGRNDAETGSVASVSSSKLQRRRKRASVLRRIIYLKRRCIRCYFVNVIFGFIVLVLQIDMLIEHSDLFIKHFNFMLRRACFGCALLLIVIGSVMSLYSLTKKLRKCAFFNGNVLLAMGVALNAFLMVDMFFISMIPTDGKMIYGYPKDLVEDCEAYPDHTFKFYLQPEKRKGRPVVETILDKANMEESQNDDEDEETTPDDTHEAKEVTESYDCEDMLSNIVWFKRTNYLVFGMLIITGVTLTISWLGIVHLWFIHLGGLDYSILPPSLVEPYEFYDALMKHNHSVESIPEMVDNQARGQTVV